MIKQSLSEGGHQWEKQNLITVFRGKGCYDVYACSCCGITGKSRSLGSIDIPEKYASKAGRCPGRKALSQIRVTHSIAVGKPFGNCSDGSIHQTIEPPAGKDRERGEWVMGVGEPVLLLFDEFVYIN